MAPNNFFIGKKYQRVCLIIILYHKANRKIRTMPNTTNASVVSSEMGSELSPVLYSLLYGALILIGITTIGPMTACIILNLKKNLNKSMVYGLVCMGLSDLTVLLFGLSRYILIYLINYDIRLQSSFLCQGHSFITTFGSDFSIFLKLYLSIAHANALFLTSYSKNRFCRILTSPELGIIIFAAVLLIKDVLQAESTFIIRFGGDLMQCMMETKGIKMIFIFFNGGSILFIYPMISIFNIAFIFKMTQLHNIHYRLTIPPSAIAQSPCAFRYIAGGEDNEYMNGFLKTSRGSDENSIHRAFRQRNSSRHSGYFVHKYCIMTTVIATNFIYLFCFLPCFIMAMVFQFGSFIKLDTPIQSLSQTLALTKVAVTFVYVYHSINMASYFLTYRHLRREFLKSLGVFKRELISKALTYVSLKRKSVPNYLWSR